MKIISIFLVTLFFNTAYAGPVELARVKDGLKAISDLKTTILTSKMRAEANAKDLKAQRDSLQQKILAARQDFKNSSISTKESVRRVLDNLESATKKLKEVPKISSEAQEAEQVINQSSIDIASLKQLSDSFDSVELPVPIS